MKRFSIAFPSIRLTHLYGSVVCIALLLIAAYMQVAWDLAPCPLCILQRILVLILGFIFLCGYLCHTPKNLRLHALSLFSVSLLGVATAGWQVWLQHSPAEQAQSCTPNLGYMLENFPLWEVIKTTIQSGGHCHEVQWDFLGLSLAGWMVLFFLAVCVLAIINFRRTGDASH